MNYKFLLNQLDEEGNIIKSKEMKTIREISKLLSIEYHQARLLYLLSHKESKKGLHPLLKQLSKKYTITDNNVNKFNDVDLD
jgi:hypothetical protein